MYLVRKHTCPDVHARQGGHSCRGHAIQWCQPCYRRSLTRIASFVYLLMVYDKACTLIYQILRVRDSEHFHLCSVPFHDSLSWLGELMACLFLPRTLFKGYCSRFAHIIYIFVGRGNDTATLEQFAVNKALFFSPKITKFC